MNWQNFSEFFMPITLIFIFLCILIYNLKLLYFPSKHYGIIQQYYHLQACLAYPHTCTREYMFNESEYLRNQAIKTKCLPATFFLEIISLCDYIHDQYTTMLRIEEGYSYTLDGEGIITLQEEKHPVDLHRFDDILNKLMN